MVRPFRAHGAWPLGICLLALYAGNAWAERVKERLEAFPISELCLVEIERFPDGFRAVVEDPQRQRAYLRPGNYLGQHHGRVLSVESEHVEVVEIVIGPDGKWGERPAPLRACQERTH